MGRLSNFLASFGPIPEPEPRTRAADPAVVAVGTGAGGRLSVDTAFSFFGVPSVIVPPGSAEEQWRTIQLDADTLGRMTPTRLMELLADLSPEVSRALWDFLRLCNPGWSFAAIRPGATKPDPAATAAVQSFLDTLGALYGSPDVVWGRLFMSAFLRGALMAELVLDEAGRLPVDFATPDPASARYRRVEDPVRGIVWQLGQWQNRPAGYAQAHGGLAGFVPLDRPTIRYVPIDPLPGSPYGRAMAAPALFSTLFLLGMLHDLRRVIAQQGYPRLDASLVMERLRAAMPASQRDDPAAVKAWVADAIREVQALYARLQPDDMFVHTDLVQLNSPQGVSGNKELGFIDNLIELLERMATRALKSTPFMMGSNQSTTESQALREWEALLATIRSVQHYGETTISGLLTLACRAQGLAAVVAFTFAENRASEEMRDEQTRALKIANARSMYNAGLISQDEAAQLAAGKATADVPAPRILERGETETTEAAAAQLAPESAGAADGRTRIRVVGED